MSKRLAVGQMTSTDNEDQNFRDAQFLVQDAAENGALLLGLPECFSFLGATDGASAAVAEPLAGPRLARYRALAREHGLWLVLGGFPEESSDQMRPFNTSVVVDDRGDIAACYRKIHLFDVDVPGGPVLTESKGVSAGDEIVVVDSPVGRLGLTICYDLRFPVLYQALRNQGAEVMLVPAAFTATTGKAHWEVLLRARAIENQCYVAAPAQRGRHNPKRESHGDALIADPWGVVVARCPDRTSIAVAEIDLDAMAAVRARLPVASHQRADVYGGARDRP